jgi:Family of unknown function (DUF7033)
MLLYSHTINPRLKYITDFIGNELLKEPFQLTTSRQFFHEYEGAKINYSKEKTTSSEFRIESSELLFENGVRPQAIECFERNGYKMFYKADGDFHFDIFAASFYLLSRYEEYLPYKKDIYGRYAHENSLAFKENFLHLPIINIWLENFKTALKIKYPDLQFPHRQFQFIPTYDIDEAYSYKYKQWWRTLGGFAKSITKGQWSKIGERIGVLSGKKKDPFDSYQWMNQLHRQYNLKPYYFFLVAGKTGRYDKNILSQKKTMQDLIRDHSDQYSIGIHPSWQSGDDPAKLKFEILKLGHISGKQVIFSRQHFIRFTLPDTFRQLIDLGIKSDFSMGYGSLNGFRASVASPFYWYDLEKERQTELLVYPFCFMEANSFFEQKFSPQQALEELRYYYDVVKSVNGTLITIWHNTFLGADKLFEGWREIYQEFISLVKS